MEDNFTSTTSRNLVDDLRKIEIFSDLSLEQLDWLAEHLQEMHFQPG